MTMTGADWTNSWRALAQIDAPAAGATIRCADRNAVRCCSAVRPGSAAAMLLA